MPRSKRATLSPDTIIQARKLLTALPPPVPTSHTIRQAVQQLHSEIAALRDQGYSLAQIADHLNSAGIPVANSTLRNYTAQTQPRRKRGKNAPRPDVRKAPAPAKTKVASPPPSQKSIATKSQKTLSTKIGGPVSRSGRFTPDPDSKDL